VHLGEKVPFVLAQTRTKKMHFLGPDTQITISQLVVKIEFFPFPIEEETFCLLVQVLM
jgi:hypothetical protein